MIQKELSRLYKQCDIFAKHLSKQASTKLIKHQCCLCLETSTERICSGCETDFLITPRYACQCCGLPLEHFSLFCGNCLTNIPDFDRSYCPFLYQKPLSDAILLFKEQGDQVTGKALAELFARKIKQHYQEQQLPLPDLLAPVPLHWKKQWQRGFNQSLFFCKDIKQLLGIPIAKGIKKTGGDKPDQKELTRKQRMQAMQNSFKVKTDLTGKHVAIVDDVMTTGATANALAQQLKAAGASQVSVWALARTPA